MSQVELGQRMGVSASYIAAVEAGRSNPTVGQLAAFANGLGVAISIEFVSPEVAAERNRQSALASA
jgi:transcriptional regulator with XRE-family HTH domain